MLNLKEYFNATGFGIDVDITTNLCYIKDFDSSTGKTLLLNALSYVLDKKSVLINYANYGNVNSVISYVKSLSGIDVILMDNADLYISEDLCNEALKRVSTVIIVGRRWFSNNLSSDNFYRVDWKDNVIYLRKGI